MTNEFIPYEEALALRDLGFDEGCISYYNTSNTLKELETSDWWCKRENDFSYALVAPLYQQVFRWFRENHQLFHEILVDITTAPKYAFEIHRFIGNPDDLTEREWDWERILQDDWYLYRKYEEAELACLRKLIKIVKNK